MVPKPKDAQEAALQVRVMERAKVIAAELKKGGEYYCYMQNSQPNFWGMGKRSGSAKADTVYLLNLADETCSCQFHAEKHYCKHLIALNLSLEEEADEAQCEQAEREMRDCELWETGVDPFARF